MRKVVRETPEYTVAVAQCPDGLLAFHIDVHVWNKTVYKKLLCEAWDLYFEYQGNMYTMYMDPKQEKFMRMMNFHPTDIVCFDTDGVQHLMYKFGGDNGN